MDNLKRDYRVAKHNLVRLRTEIAKLIEPTINIENLAELECLLLEYRKRKKIDLICDEIIGSFDESGKDYTTNVSSYLKEGTQASRTLSGFQAKINNFRKQLSAETTTDSLLNVTFE